MAGPPCRCSQSRPVRVCRAAVSRNGYRLTTSSSMVPIPCSARAAVCSAAGCQQAGVYVRMQCLYPAVQQLREASHLFDAERPGRLPECCERSAGRDQLETMLSQSGRELSRPVLSDTLSIARTARHSVSVSSASSVSRPLPRHQQLPEASPVVPARLVQLREVDDFLGLKSTPERVSCHCCKILISMSFGVRQPILLGFTAGLCEGSVLTSHGLLRAAGPAPGCGWRPARRSGHAAPRSRRLGSASSTASSALTSASSPLTTPAALLRHFPAVDCGCVHRLRGIISSVHIGKGALGQLLPSAAAAASVPLPSPPSSTGAAMNRTSEIRGHRCRWVQGVGAEQRGVDRRFSLAGLRDARSTPMPARLLRRLGGTGQDVSPERFSRLKVPELEADDLRLGVLV